MMNTSKLLLNLFLTFFLFSCQDNNGEGEVVYTETYNIDELEDSPESDDDFMKKYSDYLNNTIEIYNLKEPDIIDEKSNLTSESSEINQTLKFEFEYSTDNIIYYVSNNLTNFYNLGDVKTGWDLGEKAFWSGFLSDKVTEKSFNEFKNKKIHATGDYSEYSELPTGNSEMIIFHIRWRKLIIYYTQLINPELKDELMDKIHDNFEKIKEVYSEIDQEKIDQVVDKSIENIKKEGL